MAFTKKEKEVKDLNSIKNGFKSRIITYEDGEKVLDIREYVESEKYTGFTKRGMRLNKEEAEKAVEVIRQAVEQL